jgi:mono/diheme cytochrome c family protein
MRLVSIAFPLFAFLLLVTVSDFTHYLPQAWADSQGATQSRARDMDQKPSMGDSKRGEELYKASCIVCHGPRAMGGIGPRLAGNTVLSNDEAFWKIVYEGRHVMPPLKGAVNEQQMEDIRAWLKTLP